MVLAKDHPEITAIFPHTSGLQAVTMVGRDFSGVNDIKSSRTISRKVLSWNFRFQLCIRTPIAFLLQAHITMAGLGAIAVCFGRSDDSSGVFSGADQPPRRH